MVITQPLRSTFILNPGEALTVVADARSSGVVARLGDSAGSTTQGVTPISTGSTTIIGPYHETTRFDVVPSVGSLTVTQAIVVPRITDDGTDINIVSVTGVVQIGDPQNVQNNTFIYINDALKVLAFYAGPNTFYGNALFRGDPAGGSVSLFAQQTDYAETKVELSGGDKTIILTTDATTGIIKSVASKVIQSAPATTPAAALGNGQISFYLDEVGDKLMVAVKYSDGTSKVGEVALA